MKRPPFKLAGSATIKHINIRKEGPQDDKILAVDLKLEFEQIDGGICAYFDDAMAGFLWRDSAMIVRNAFLAPLEYGHTISCACVEIDDHRFFGAEVKKFKIEPKDGGRITLNCAVSLQPSTLEVSDFARRLQDSATVTIEGPPDLFDAAPAPNQPQDTTASLPLDNVVITLKGRKSDAEPPATDEPADSGPDPLYDQAINIVQTERKASVSLVQRRLQIGYNRAARLIEAMEKAGRLHRGPDGTMVIVY